jgi:diaminohydroxyphosphoribosylaminopyrimidine deaminase/5-amino-6-(5-phosphoribosylamino)uracil reductase
LIAEAGVARVVAAMRDPDPRVSGQGFEELRAGGVLVDVGVCGNEALALNRAFVINKTLGRPMVILKAATSLDACVASHIGARTALTCREANQRSHHLRAHIDAIAVGSETVRVDDPLLTARGPYRERPLLRLIFDRRLRTDPRARLFTTLQQGPVVIVASRDAPRENRIALEQAGAEIMTAQTLNECLQGLAQRGIMTLLVEGGPSLHAAFVDAGLFDRVHLIVTPHVLGPTGVRWLDVQTLELPYGSVVAEPRGADIWIEADVYRNH